MHLGGLWVSLTHRLIGRYGFIRGQSVTSAFAPDGRHLKAVIGADNTSREVRADSADRSRSNEKWLAAKMLVSRIGRKKPKGKPMPGNHPVARMWRASSPIGKIAMAC